MGSNIYLDQCANHEGGISCTKDYTCGYGCILCFCRAAGQSITERETQLAVGGNRERGVVAAASYEARKYGVRSAMPSKIAARKCPELIFVKPRFDRYKEISLQIREIFFDYTDLVEPLSLDEAFLDVTVNKKDMPYATKIAREIRNRIKIELGLNASAGISYNKFLAKIASDLNKPNGQAVILPEDAEAFLEKLPIEKFFGIGKVTAEKMQEIGIHTGAELKSAVSKSSRGDLANLACTTTIS